MDFEPAYAIAQKQADLLITLAQVTGKPTLQLDPQGRILKVNRVVEETTGYSSDELCGHLLWERLLLGSECTQFETFFAEMCVGRTAAVSVNGWLTKTGEVRQVDFTYWPTSAPDGSIEQITAIGSSTAVKGQISANALGVGQLEAMLQDAPVVVVILGLGPGFVVLNHNSYYRRFVPESSIPASFTGRQLTDLVPNDEAENLTAIFSMVERTGKATSFTEFPFDGFPGGRTWWNWFLSPLFGHDGKCIALSVFAVDVTESVQARHSLEETNQRLIAEMDKRAKIIEQLQLQSNLLDAVEQAVIATDLNGTIVFWNRFAESLYGWSAEEAIGQLVTTIIPAAGQTEAAIEIMENLRSGQNWAGEFLVQHRNGHYFPAHVLDSPIHNDNGELIGIVGISSDISERKRSEDEIRRLNETLEKRVLDRTHELSVLYDVASLAVQAIDVNVILQKVMSIILSNLHCLAVTVQWAEADAVSFTLLGQTGLPTILMPLFNGMPKDVGIPGRILADGKPVVLHNLLTEEWGTEVVRAAGLSTYMGVPMRRGGATVGVLSVLGDGLHAYHVEDIALLGSIADQLTVIIHNSQLWALTQQHLRQLNLLYQADRTLHSHLELEQVLQALPDLAVDIGGASSAWLLRSEPAKAHFSLWGQRSLNTVLKEAVGYTPGAKLATYVAATGEPILIEDVQSDERISRPDLLEVAGIRSLGCIPLVVNDTMAGVLNIAFEQPGAVNLEAWRFCVALAERATLAIKNAQIYERAQQVAVLEERQRMARELHDSVNQVLFGLVTFTESRRQQSLRQSDADAATQWKMAKEIAQQAMKEMRLLMHELRPEAVQRQGLVSALKYRLNTVEQRVGIEAQFVTRNLPANLPAEVEDALYHIAQEALNNAIKHAQATQVTVELEASANHINLRVVDNGCGFDLDTVYGNGGMGLSNLTERAAVLGGEMHIWSTPGGGTKIESSIPILSTPKEASG